MTPELRLGRWQDRLADVADASVRLILGRRFIGAERVPKYHAIGVRRLAQTSIFDRIEAPS